MGLVFDHGCDAFTTGLTTLISLRIVNCGNNVMAYALLLLTLNTFHFSTLEEYYVGTLVLPIFNGVSDGSVALIITYLFLGIVGWETATIPVCSGEWT